MTIIYPEGVSTLANTTHLWVASIANEEAPELSELTVASPGALNVSCALYAGVFAPTQSVARAAAPRRSCERDVFERTTSVTRSIPDITYAISPQAANGSDGKKAYEVLTEGKVGFIVERMGLDVKTAALQAGQFVNIYPVTLGPALIIAPNEDGSEYQVTQAIDLRGKPVQNVVIVSGSSSSSSSSS